MLSSEVNQVSNATATDANLYIPSSSLLYHVIYLFILPFDDSWKYKV